MDRNALRDFDLGGYDVTGIHENCRELAADRFPIISEANLRATRSILARPVAPGAARPVIRAG